MPTTSQTPKPSGVLYAIRIETDRSFAAILDDRLPDMALPSASWSDEDRDRARVEVFFNRRIEAQRALAALRPSLRAMAAGHAWTAAVARMPRENWAESWKKFFHCERVSRRIVVKPSWESFKPRPADCVVTIDPGMSFGTGQHATTRACLTLLDAAAGPKPPPSFLDVGCGSGILAIAAAKLGVRRIAAFDDDPEALRIARRNARANQAGRAIRFFRADVRRFESPAPYDIVAANLLAPLLIESAGNLVRALSPGPASRLLVSGVLAEQYGDVRRAFEARGLKEKQSLTIGDWRTGRFDWPARARR